MSGSVVNYLLELLEKKGSDIQYGNEDVTQLEIFSKEEAEEFINKPQMKEAVEMRRFDDQAKILNKTTPSVEHFRKYVENSFQSNSN